MHILHLEDDGPLREILKVALEAVDPECELIQFVSSDLADTYITSNHRAIDLYVLDIRVPGSMNGMQLAEKIRTVDVEGAIVVTSAYGRPSQDFLNSNGCQWYSKPWHILETPQMLLKLAGGSGRKKPPEQPSTKPPEQPAPPATKPPESFVRELPDQPSTKPPEQPVTRITKQLGTKPPAPPAAKPPESFVRELPEQPSTKPPEQPVARPPVPPAAKPPEPPVVKPPESFVRELPDQPSTKPPEPPAPPAAKPSESFARKWLEQSSTKPPEPPVTKPPESSDTKPTD